MLLFAEIHIWEREQALKVLKALHLNINRSINKLDVHWILIHMPTNLTTDKFDRKQTNTGLFVARFVLLGEVSRVSGLFVWSKHNIMCIKNEFP